MIGFGRFVTHRAVVTTQIRLRFDAVRLDSTSSRRCHQPIILRWFVSTPPMTNSTVMSYMGFSCIEWTIAAVYCDVINLAPFTCYQPHGHSRWAWIKTVDEKSKICRISCTKRRNSAPVRDRPVVLTYISRCAFPGARSRASNVTRTFSVPPRGLKTRECVTSLTAQHSRRRYVDICCRLQTSCFVFTFLLRMFKLFIG